MNDKVREYNTKAAKFVAGLPMEDREALPLLTAKGPNFADWKRYFDEHLGARPYAFQRLCYDPNAQMTMPTERPEWFDSSFAPRRNHAA